MVALVQIVDLGLLSSSRAVPLESLLDRVVQILIPKGGPRLQRAVSQLRFLAMNGGPICWLAAL